MPPLPHLARASVRSTAALLGRIPFNRTRWSLNDEACVASNQLPVYLLGAPFDYCRAGLLLLVMDDSLTKDMGRAATRSRQVAIRSSRFSFEFDSVRSHVALTMRSSRHRSASWPRRQVELATWPTPLHDAA